MSITINNGGVLKTLSEITVNNGGTLYSLDTVSANVGEGVIKEVFSKNTSFPGINTLSWYKNNYGNVSNTVDFLFTSYATNNTHTFTKDVSTSTAIYPDKPFLKSNIFTIDNTFTFSFTGNLRYVSGGSGCHYEFSIYESTKSGQNNYKARYSYGSSTSGSQSPWTLPAGSYYLILGGGCGGYNYTGYVTVEFTFSFSI